MIPRHTKTLLKSAAAFMLLGAFGHADISLPLQPGYAVHTFGVSPDANNGDGNATVRIYDTTARGYDATRPTVDINKSTSYTDSRWNIDKIGNVYGIAIDKDKNIYVTASANWSPGYVGTGNSGNDNVPVKYGVLGGGETNTSAGTVYELDANDGTPAVFAHLPQKQVEITNQVCQGNGHDVTRSNVGAGLGNIVYDKFHHQYFVSNFSDGKIYRLDANGATLNSFVTGMSGIDANGKALNAPYGLAVGPEGKKLYFGTIYTGDYQQERLKPELYAVALSNNGNFSGSKVSQDAKLIKNIAYTQNPGGDAVDDGVWAAYSDLSFTPEGDLLVGVRVGCNYNFATSYNHGGVVYLLKKDNDGKYNQASKASQNPTHYDHNDAIDNSDNQNVRAGNYDNGNAWGQNLYDDGAIPLHPYESSRREQAQLQYGPDDGYGGVAVWQTSEGDFDLYATSADITSKEGVHGFMQFNGKVNIDSDKGILKEAIGYPAVKSSTSKVATNANPHDYKGIGGDVEVLSVVPVSVGSCVWEDKNKDGIQDNNEPGIGGVNLKLVDEAGNKIATTITKSDCTYKFDNLPEGKYRVCFVDGLPSSSDNKFVYLKTPKQNGTSDNKEMDSNFMADSNCSALFSVFANTQLVESGAYRGDKADDNASNPYQDKNGNMTIDFGFVKSTFDLALKKELLGDKNKKYKIGEQVKFKITVKNQGNTDATNITIKDTVPTGLDCNTDVGTDGILKNKIDSLAAGEEKSLTITCEITKAVGENGSIINVAEIASSKNSYDLNDTDSTPNDQKCGNDMKNNNDYDGDDSKGCDDIDPAIVRIDQHFDLALKKVVKASDGKKFKKGDDVIFTITVYNQGTLTGKDIQIQDDIPDGLKLNDPDWMLSGTTAVLKNKIASLAPGKTTTRDITFTITKSSGKIINIAELKSAKNDLKLPDDDSAPGDNKPCKTEVTNGHNNNVNTKDQCDDADPAWITVDQPNSVAGASETKSDSDSGTQACDCNGVEGNSVDTMSTTIVFLMILGILLIGFLQSREEATR